MIVHQKRLILITKYTNLSNTNKGYDMSSKIHRWNNPEILELFKLLMESCGVYDRHSWEIKNKPVPTNFSTSHKKETLNVIANKLNSTFGFIDGNLITPNGVDFQIRQVVAYNTYDVNTEKSIHNARLLAMEAGFINQSDISHLDDIFNNKINAQIMLNYYNLSELYDLMATNLYARKKLKESKIKKYDIWELILTKHNIDKSTITPETKHIASKLQQTNPLELIEAIEELLL